MEAWGETKKPSILSIINRENPENGSTQKHPYAPVTINMAAAAVVAVSPFPYPNEPPPRYETSTAYPGRSSSLHGLITSPEFQPICDQKNEPRRSASATAPSASPVPLAQPQQHRQSLPSIHEALAAKPIYPSPLAAPAHSPRKLAYSESPVLRTYLPTDHSIFPSQMSPRHSQRHGKSPQSAHFPQGSVARQVPESTGAIFSETPSGNFSVGSVPAAPNLPGSYNSPRYEPTKHEPTASEPSPTTERTPNVYVPPPPPPTQSAHICGPASVGNPVLVGAPPQPPYQMREVWDAPESWHGTRDGEKLDTAHNFRGGLKRNLDVWDFENNLAEINIASSALQEWSAHYNAIAQEQQRTVHVLPDRMPTTDSIQEMKKHQDKILNCLEHITRIINEAKQQQSEQAMLEQRSQEQSGRSGEYDDEMSVYGDEIKNHTFTTEGKKRRGRAVPPGRCHSCNRAETPEWRRGPDGARTLCNACGLHYAKLTRKNITNKPSQASNSASAIRTRSLNVSPRLM